MRGRFITGLVWVFVAGCTTTVQVVPSYVVGNRSEPGPSLDDLQWETVAAVAMSVPARANTRAFPEQFASALRSLAAGDPDAALVVLRRLEANPETRASARELIVEALERRGEWAKIWSDYQTTGYVRANAGSYRVFARSPREVRSLPPNPVSVTNEPTEGEIFRIAVSINGTAFHFGLDTGASFTVLSRATAAAASVDLGAALAIEVSTEFGDRSVRAAVTDLRFGGAEFQNHRCLVMQDGFLPSGVDGLVGWEALRRLRVVFDHPRGSVTFSAPHGPVRPNRRNLVWLQGPHVLCKGISGRLVVGHVDTAGRSRVFPSGLSRLLAAEDVGRGEVLPGTFTHRGEPRKIKVVRQLRLAVGGHDLTLQELPCDEGANEYYDYVDVDFRLGREVLSEATVVVDFTEGRLELIR